MRPDLPPRGQRLISPASLQVESEANGLPVDGLTRTQLSRQVKARREALPAKVGKTCTCGGETGTPAATGLSCGAGG